jgi:hypothetical protein
VETASRTALWLLLGGWVGSWALFGLVVAPTAFRILPSTQIAGQLVGPVLTALHLYGGLAGVALALLARGLGRRPLLVALPLLMGALCLASHFGISLRLDEIRDLAFGPTGNSQAAGRFNLLHQVSLGIYVAVGLMAVALTALHASADARDRAGRSG